MDHGTRMRLGDTARAQHGNLTRGQCRDAGLSDRQVTRAVERGELLRVRPAVYRFGVIPGGWRSDLMADTLAAPRGGWASHASALRLHGVPVESVRAPRHITTVGEGRVVASPRTIVHRTNRLDPVDRQVVDGIPVTSLARTMVDAATMVDRWRMLEVLDEVICAHPDQREGVHAAAVRLIAGRRNVAALAEATSPGAEEVFWSWLERTASPLVQQAGIWDARWNVRVPGHPGLGVVDTWSEASQLIIDWKGLAFHRRPNDLQRDSEKQNAAMMAGLRTLSFTWTDVVRRPLHVVRTSSQLAQAA